MRRILVNVVGLRTKMRTKRLDVNRVRKRIAQHDKDRLYNGIANKTDERTRSRVPKGVSKCIACRLKTLLVQWFDW